MRFEVRAGSRTRRGKVRVLRRANDTEDRNDSVRGRDGTKFYDVSRVWDTNRARRSSFRWRSSITFDTVQPMSPPIPTKPRDEPSEVPGSLWIPREEKRRAHFQNGNFIFVFGRNPSGTNNGNLHVILHFTPMSWPRGAK